MHKQTVGDNDGMNCLQRDKSSQLYRDIGTDARGARARPRTIMSLAANATLGWYGDSE